MYYVYLSAVMHFIIYYTGTSLSLLELSLVNNYLFQLHADAITRAICGIMIFTDRRATTVSRGGENTADYVHDLLCIYLLLPKGI